MFEQYKRASQKESETQNIIIKFDLLLKLNYNTRIRN